MVNNIPLNGWPQLKDLEAVQPTLDRLDKIEAWKRTVKEETFTGEEITIPNALALPARSLITSIEPIQDLHGYDKPWVGGAYKNKLPTILSAIKANNTHGTWNGNSFTYEGITATVNTDSVGNITGFSCNGTSSNVFYFNIGTYGFVSGTDVCMSGGKSADKYLVVQGLSSLKDTGSGLVINTVDETKWIQLVILSGQTCSNEVFYPQLESGSTATSFAPYSNICPISGRDSVVVERTSANYVTEYLNGSNVIADGSIVSNEQYSLALMPVKQGETYTASHNTESYWVWAFYRSKPTIGSGSYNNDRTLDTISASKTFTAPIDGYIAIRVPVTYRELMVNGGSTALPYEPSYATGFTIQLGTTVYGADINWDTGVATVKTAKIDFGTLNYLTATVGGKAFYYADVPNAPQRDYTAISSDYPVTNSESEFLANDGIARAYGTTLYGGFARVGIIDSRYSGYTTAQFKEAMSGVDYEYELATPTTLQLTPTEVQMLKGYNRVTLSDGYGTIELKALTGANWS